MPGAVDSRAARSVLYAAGLSEHDMNENRRTWILAAVAALLAAIAAPVSGLAQSHAHKHRTAKSTGKTAAKPAAKPSATETCRGEIADARGKALPGMDHVLTAFYVRSGEYTLRFVVRFTASGAYPMTIVEKNGKRLTRAAALEALNAPGDDVVVEYAPTPYGKTKAYLATKVTIGGTTMSEQQSDNGLQIEDLQVGTGAEATPGHQVTVHYTGTLTDGQKFDSSVDRGQPFKFMLGGGQVIRGWDEGVAGMRVGGKRRLVIPPQLGYGSRGIGPIPPNSTLVFEVELLKVD
jgi:FKBP-type peptidyl-prolyl cis-trans isomerase FkpA